MTAERFAPEVAAAIDLFVAAFRERMADDIRVLVGAIYAAAGDPSPPDESLAPRLGDAILGLFGRVLTEAIYDSAMDMMEPVDPSQPVS